MSEEPLAGEVEEPAGELVVFQGRTMRKAAHGGSGPRLAMLPDPPWEKAKGERARDYHLFDQFLALGPDRSVRELHRRLGGSLGRIGTRASRWRWHERAELYDAEQVRVRRSAEEKARVEMGERHAQIAMGLQQRALARLQQIQPESLDARDVARFLDVATRLERLARGEPTEITENEHRHSVKALSDDELDAFERGA